MSFWHYKFLPETYLLISHLTGFWNGRSSEPDEIGLLNPMKQEISENKKTLFFFLTTPTT